MKKIPSLFERHYEGTRKVWNSRVNVSNWVDEPGVIATRKYDGTAVLFKDGEIYIRFDAKPGRNPPEEYIPCIPEPDPITGHWPLWVKPKKGQDKYILEAIANLGYTPEDGTYEVCGPKIGTRHGANPENLTKHVLFKHGEDVVDNCPTGFHEVMRFLKDMPIEGIVWYHPDGRMAKIKKNDFPY